MRFFLILNPYNFVPVTAHVKLENNYSKVINFDYLADLGLIEDENLNLFQYVDTALEEWKIIKSSKISD